MLAIDNKPLSAWPKVRPVRQGVLRVKGRVIPVFRWLIVRRVSTAFMYLPLLWLLGAACLPWLVGIPNVLGHNNPLSWIVMSMMNARFGLRDFLTEQYSQIGEALFYTGRNPFDWHLLAIFSAFFWLRKPLGLLLARFLVVLLWPFISRGFKITFYRDVVVLHRWLRNLKMSRAAIDGGISFRVAGPEYQRWPIGWLLKARMLRPNAEADYLVVMAAAGLRQFRVATPYRMHTAEQIVQSFQLAMNHTR